MQSAPRGTPIADAALDISTLALRPTAIMAIRAFCIKRLDLNTLATFTDLRRVTLIRTTLASQGTPRPLSTVRALTLVGIDASKARWLHAFVGLQRLSLHRVSLAGLNPLHKLARLRELSFSEVKLGVDTTTAMRQVHTLDWSATTTAEFTLLRWFPALRRLSLDSTDGKLSSLASLRLPRGLERLSLGPSRVRSLAPLVTLKSLRALSITGNPVRDLAPLANLPLLRQLGLFQTDVEALSPLRRLGGLQTLAIVGGPLREIGPLATLTQLRSLRLHALRLATLSPLARLKSLRVLSLQLPRVDLAAVGQLAKLRQLALNTVGMLQNVDNLQQLRQLRSLDLSESPFRDVALIVGLGELRELDLRHSRVTRLRGLQQLKHLRLLRVTRRRQGSSLGISSNEIAWFARRRPDVRLLTNEPQPGTEPLRCGRRGSLR